MSERNDCDWWCPYFKGFERTQKGLYNLKCSSGNGQPNDMESIDEASRFINKHCNSESYRRCPFYHEDSTGVARKQRRKERRRQRQ